MWRRENKMADIKKYATMMLQKIKAFDIFLAAAFLFFPQLLYLQ